MISRVSFQAKRKRERKEREKKEQERERGYFENQEKRKKQTCSTSHQLFFFYLQKLLLVSTFSLQVLSWNYSRKKSSRMVFIVIISILIKLLIRNIPGNRIFDARRVF